MTFDHVDKFFPSYPLPQPMAGGGRQGQFRLTNPDRRPTAVSLVRC